METADTMGTALAPLLKERHYKKRRWAWKKELEDVTIFFDIQKSLYSPELWYYNLEVIINALHINDTRWHPYHDMSKRITDGGATPPIVSVPRIIREIDLWEDEVGSAEKLREMARTGTLLPIGNTAREYLLN